MASTDPYLWSIDQVVDQVCSRTSDLHAAIQIKPILALELLEVALRTNDIDGEALLALEDVNVKEDLGIGSFGQRREIRKTVLYLRSLSARYKSSLEEPQPKRTFKSETEPTGSTPEVHPQSKKRRITPQNIASEPTFARPEEFNQALLESDWQDFLERHKENPDEDVLRPYNESDQEKELDSDDSLFHELQSDVDILGDVPKPGLSKEQINDVIDDTVRDYQDSWNTYQRARKHKTAYRRWVQAAKAGTRKPQQNALLRELDQYRVRLAKFYEHIANSSGDYRSEEEVRRNCLNLQATVEDITEREYYLEVLDSNEPPPKPENPPTVPKPEPLSDGEEILSSESSDVGDASQRSESPHDMSVTSESGVSLLYDPDDTDWHPQLPQPAERPDTPMDDWSPPGMQLDTIDSSPVIPLLDEQPPTIPIQPEALPEQALAAPFPSKSQQAPTLDCQEDEDSDLDYPPLPESRYRSLGKTRDDAISLGSSPSSEHGSIRTPPLNPTIPTKPRGLVQMQYPAIQETRALKWVDIKDPFLALCKIVYRHSRETVKDVLEHVSQMTNAEVPEALRAGIAEIQDANDMEDDPVEDTQITWTFFFVVYACCKGYPEVWNVPERRLDSAYEMIAAKGSRFDKVLRPLLRHYIDTNTDNGASKQPFQAHQPIYQANTGLLPIFQSTTTQNQWSDTDTDADSGFEEITGSISRRKRPTQLSQEARANQKDDRYRVLEQEERRLAMMAKFMAIPSEERMIPINTDQRATIYLDQHISRRVKDHQVAGIQFLWRELIEDKKHQGCLLAHTMGLGKTMQVVSFLVTLAQTNASNDPKVKELIPNSLRSRHVLVLCPASLVDNWFDELLMWIPPNAPNLLGRVYRISGGRANKERTVKEWSVDPGILLASYESVRSLLSPRKGTDDLAELEEALLNKPCVVVGDEAHKMKNAKSSINALAKRFRTTSRIALTGSPLNNHLEEYHTMIDWVAPGYLGSLAEFKGKYSEPIERGLAADSTRYEQRKCLQKLYVLKRDLAPKIDRKDISAIAADMPQKTEFFITIPLTDLQKDMYTIMVKHILSGLAADGKGIKSSNAQLWSWLSILSWLCNHPACLIRKLEEKDSEGYANAMNEVNEDQQEFPADIDMRGSPITSLLPRFLECFRATNMLDHMNDPSLSERAMVSQRLINEAIAQDEKTLLFSHSIPTLDYLQIMLDNMNCKYLRIDGSTPTNLRQHATKSFNALGSEHKVFLISTRAGGLGLNLQGATRVIIYDFGFNPSWEEQAIGRAYRLGQKKPVFVYRFRAGGTFEEAIYNRSIFKTQLFARVVDQKNVVRHGSKKIEDYLFIPKEAERFDFSESRGKDSLLDRVIDLAPDAIRNLILTETFQREDEADELNEEEQKQADAQVEMERLARIDPQEFLRRMQEKEAHDRAQRTAQLASTLPTGRPLNEINFSQIWNAGLMAGASTNGVVSRPKLNGTQDTNGVTAESPRKDPSGVSETGTPGYKQQQ